MARSLPITPGRRFALFAAADFVLVGASLLLAWLLRFEGVPPEGSARMYLVQAAAAGALLVGAAYAVGLYRASWSFVGLRDIGRVAAAVVAATLVMLVSIHALRLAGVYPTPSIGVTLIQAPLAFCAVAGFRVSRRAARMLLQGTSLPAARERVLIVGGGAPAAEVIKSIEVSPEAGRLHVVGVVDDDPKSHGVSIQGVTVLGPISELSRHLAGTSAQAVIICIPSADRALVQFVVRVAREAGVHKVRILPSVAELFGGAVSVETTRAVTLEDLLGRDPVAIDLAAVREALAGRTVVVTGGAGTIGSELCRQIVRCGVSTLVVVDVDETRLHEICIELDGSATGGPRVVPALVDVRDPDDLEALFTAHRVDSVFHAAAYKHVPMMETHAVAALSVNVLGTWNVLQAAERHGVRRFVLISTDKAVEPSSVMGASKRLAELVTFGAPTSRTRATAVRFGNVIGSRGSVVPLFERQLRAGGPLTVTHPEVERYFMMTSEAVQLVLQTAVLAEGRDIFVLDMGKPVRILDVAREFIRLHGRVPETEIPIVFTGLRPGEKLTESLHHPDEVLERTSHPRVLRSRVGGAPAGGAIVDRVAAVVATREPAAARRYLLELFPSLADHGAPSPDAGARGTAPPLRS